MPNVKYTDTNKLSWIVSVPATAPPETYKWGVPVGPPDLSPLGLSKEDRIKLQKGLVDLNLVIAPQLMGKRAELKILLKQLGLPDTLLRELISLYQRSFYEK